MKQPLLKRLLKWVIGVPVAALVALFVIGLLAPKSVNAKREKEEVKETVEDSKPLAVKQEVIRKAKVYSWSELPTEVKAKVHDYQSYFQGGWATPRNSTQFEKQNGYYVKAVIGNKQLAELSQSKGSMPEDILVENRFMLYGKYKNRWTFQNQQGDINETSKFDGFNTISIDRVGEQDTVWVGPIPQRPTQMTILGRGDDLETKPKISL